MEEPHNEMDELGGARIHGGGVKVSRIHFNILDINGALYKRNWDEAYHKLMEMYKEVEAYLTTEESKEILDDWQKIKVEMQTVYQNRPSKSINDLLNQLDVKLRRKIVALGLDMERKEKMSEKTRAFGDDMI